MVLEKMNEYLGTCNSIADVDLNKLLIIDRFDWKKKVQDIPLLLNDIANIIISGQDKTALEVLLKSHMTTDLQKKNLALVVGPAWEALRNKIMP